MARIKVDIAGGKGARVRRTSRRVETNAEVLAGIVNEVRAALEAPDGVDLVAFAKAYREGLRALGCALSTADIRPQGLLEAARNLARRQASNTAYSPDALWEVLNKTRAALGLTVRDDLVQSAKALRAKADAPQPPPQTVRVEVVVKQEPDRVGQALDLRMARLAAGKDEEGPTAKPEEPPPPDARGSLRDCAECCKTHVCGLAPTRMEAVGHGRCRYFEAKPREEAQREDQGKNAARLYHNLQEAINVRARLHVGPKGYTYSGTVIPTAGPTFLIDFSIKWDGTGCRGNVPTALDNGHSTAIFSRRWAALTYVEAEAVVEYLSDRLLHTAAPLLGL